MNKLASEYDIVGDRELDGCMLVVGIAPTNDDDDEEVGKGVVGDALLGKSL